MPVDVVARGGTQYISNLRFLSEGEAKQALSRLEGHFKLPGRGQGTMTLHGRTRDGEAMEIRRKSGWQLAFRGERNQRLNDTVTAVRELLRRAKLDDALQHLDNYLAQQPAGQRNRIPVSEFLRILGDRLHQDASTAPVPVSAQQEIDVTGLMQGHELTAPLEPEPTSEGKPLTHPDVTAHQADPSPPSDVPHSNRALPHQFDDALMEQLAAPQGHRELPLGTPSELLQRLGIQSVSSLGKGASGEALRVRLPGESADRVFKGFQLATSVRKDRPELNGQASVTPLTYERALPFNEANAAYLHSSKRPDLSAKMNIVGYERFVVAYDSGDGGGPRIESLDPRQLRSLLKEATQLDESGRPLLTKDGEVQMRFPVNCLGQLMPVASGALTEGLTGKLTPKELQTWTRASLEGLKANAALGIVHRDMKPENEFFDPATGKVSEIDPSMVFRQSRNRPELQYCPSKMAAGSPNFMHPRALARAPHSFETDLHAKAMSLIKLTSPGAWRTLTSNQALGGEIVHLSRSNNASNKPPVWDGAYCRQLVGTVLRENVLLTEEREALQKLRQDMDDPGSPIHFAMKMLDMASRPAKDWVVRTRAEQMYDELLADPYLQ